MELFPVAGEINQHVNPSPRENQNGPRHRWRPAVGGGAQLTPNWRGGSSPASSCPLPLTEPVCDQTPGIAVELGSRETELERKYERRKSHEQHPKLHQRL